MVFPIRRDPRGMLDYWHLLMVCLGDLNAPFHAADRVEILGELAAVALGKCAVETRDLLRHRVQNALLPAHLAQALFRVGAAAVAEQALEHEAWIVLGGQRRTGALPTDGVGVRTRITGITGASGFTGFDGQLERPKLRI